MAITYKETAATAAHHGSTLGLGLVGGGERLRDRRAPSGHLATLLALVVVDILAAQGAFHVGTGIYAALIEDIPTLRGFDSQLALIALTLPLAYYLMDVYCVHGKAPIERFPSRIKATCLLFALLISWHYTTTQWTWPPAAIALTLALAIVLPLIGESTVRTILNRWGLWGTPAVVIGAGPIGREVVRALQGVPELGLRPVGFFDNDPGGCDALPPTIQGLPVLGSVADSANYSPLIDTAIVTTPLDAGKTLEAIVAELSYRDVIVVPDLHQLPTLWVHSRDLNGLVGLQMRRNLLLRRNRLLKQTIDRLLALPLSILGLPIIAVLALWIRSVSDGSPFYTQLRVGKRGRPFKIWKLRTMYRDAEQRLERHLNANPGAHQEWMRCFKLTNDPRILPGVGHFLRATSLDELPQLLNVIRGDMSLVGPRPFPSYHLDQFDPAFQSLRSSVMPGLTGLWQVSARSDGDLTVQQALDTYYIRNWSIWIDLYILYRTFGAVFARRGAR